MSHLKDNLVVIIFLLKFRALLLQLCVVKITENLTVNKIYLRSNLQTFLLELFQPSCIIKPQQIDGVQGSIALKNDLPQNIRSSLQTCSVKEGFRNYLTNLFNLSKFLATFYHTQICKGGHFQKSYTFLPCNFT